MEDEGGSGPNGDVLPQRAQRYAEEEGEEKVGGEGEGEGDEARGMARAEMGSQPVDHPCDSPPLPILLTSAYLCVLCGSTSPIQMEALPCRREKSASWTGTFEARH